MSTAIRQALGILAVSGQIIEIRILEGQHKIRSGYFDDLDSAALNATKLNGKAHVYVTLNPCNPALLARAANRIVERPEATTSDRDILRRAWFPIDLDPVRPAGVSSTETEHEAAIARAREVYAYLLYSVGWPEPVVADSGNGAHVLYRVDLPNDPDSAELLKRCLQALALRFSDELVTVDEKVFNAARIWKVYGTTACKGDNTGERPHRQAKLLRVPDEIGVVSIDKLTALADTAPRQGAGYSTGKRLDLDRWIGEHGLDVIGPTDWGGGRKWIFHVCPWNDEHRNRSAYIVQFSNGAIAAGCHHNGCAANDWTALREAYQPGYRDKPSNGDSYPPIPPRCKLEITEAELGAARLTPACIVEDYLYCDVGVLAAPGGAGKTTLVLYEAIHVALGLPLYGLEVRTAGGVLLITAEDQREMLIARLRRIRDAMDLSDEQRRTVLNRVLIWDVTGELCRLAEQDGNNNVIITGLADAVVDAFRDDPPVMAVFDPCISFGAGERLVNDNEQALILAARRIVRSLGCCVRLIHHTGKVNARDKTLDQYSARGGSALVDGARMVAILQPWDRDDESPGRPLPYGFTLAKDENAFILARAKGSYCPSGPIIWLKRRDFAFEHHIEVKQDKNARRAAFAGQVECFLVDQLKQGRYHTQNSLFEAELGMTQKQVRKAISDLTIDGRVTRQPYPPGIVRHGPKEYIHPVSVTIECVAPRDTVSAKTPKNRSPSLRDCGAGDYCVAL